VPGGEVIDGGPVRLVDEDRFRVELRQDVAAGSGPSGFLVEVSLGDQVHQGASSDRGVPTREDG
jgi:hypothetical protein